MTPPRSPIKKNIIYFLTMFNTLTLIVTSMLFLAFFFLDIPLKYLFPFLITYAVGIVALIFLDPKNTTFHSFPTTKRFAYAILFIANIAAVILLFVLIRRYQLGEYTLAAFAGALVIINAAFIEYMYHPIARFSETVVGKWLFRTVLLAGFAGIVIAASETISSTTPPPEAPLGTPRKTFSEVTGVISTADPMVYEDTQASTPASNSSIAATETPNTAPSGTEVTGQLTTLAELEKQGIKIDSIESMDGGAQAEIRDGEIVVRVINPADIQIDQPPSTSGTGWYIRSSVKKTGGGGPLQGVVISAPTALLPSGAHKGYQSIILIADGASNIYFTTDGSDPSCDGKGSIEKMVEVKAFTLKAISCFGNDKIRGPISSYSYTLE